MPHSEANVTVLWPTPGHNSHWRFGAMKSLATTNDAPTTKGTLRTLAANESRAHHQPDDQDVAGMKTRKRGSKLAAIGGIISLGLFAAVIVAIL